MLWISMRSSKTAMATYELGLLTSRWMTALMMISRSASAGTGSRSSRRMLPCGKRADDAGCGCDRAEASSTRLGDQGFDRGKFMVNHPRALASQGWGRTIPGQNDIGHQLQTVVACEVPRSGSSVFVRAP